MRLQSVRFKNHQVLGDAYISLFNEKSSYAFEAIPDTTIDIAISEEAAPNQYTFVIGDNGVGKSFFFKTLVHAINLGAGIDDRHYKIDNLDQDNERYGTKDQLDKSIPALQKLGVFTNSSPHPAHNDGHIDFLKRYNAQMILVSSTFDQKIIHRNARYRSFNFLSSINTTDILLLRALYQHRDNDKVEKLNKLLGFNEKANWKVSYRLPIDFKGDNGNGTSRILLETTRNATIPDFLRVLSNLTTDKNNYLTVKDEQVKRDFSHECYSQIRYIF